MSDKRSQFVMRVPDGWLDQLDEGRGSLSRSAFVRLAVEEKLRGPATVTVGPEAMRLRSAVLEKKPVVDAVPERPREVRVPPASPRAPRYSGKRPDAFEPIPKGSVVKKRRG